MDNAVFKWLLAVRSRDVAVPALIFKTKAKEFAEKMNVKDFQASDGWLDRWKKRHNVSFKAVSGGGNACTSEMTAPWEETTLPTILSKYKLEEVYNTDEFGLFYWAQPDKSLNLRTEKCVGGKHSKLCLTGVAAANTISEKLPMFVIGKAKSPRCFKGVKHLPCRYRNQKRRAGWTVCSLKSGFVKSIDDSQRKRKRLRLSWIIVQHTLLSTT